MCVEEDGLVICKPISFIADDEAGGPDIALQQKLEF